MRSNLKNSKLNPEPKTLQEAKQRNKLLQGEIVKIKRQLVDPRRTEKLSKVDYLNWKKNATKVLWLFCTESDLTLAWIRSTLFRKAYELLKLLEEEGDLFPEEKEVVKQLDEYFKDFEQKENT